MNRKVLYYSVLRYKPLKISGEAINLGILFCEELGCIAKFSSIRKFSRLEHFDDEINIKSVKELLFDIREEVSALNKDGSFDIDKYIKYYNNNFCFSEVQKVFYDNVDEAIDYIENVYLRFDKDTKERLSKNEDKKLLVELFKAQNIEVKRNITTVGVCNEKIGYDLETDDFYLKYFDFNNKDLSKCVQNVKSWAWTGINSTKRVVVVYRYSDDNKNKQGIDMILKILEISKIDAYNIEHIENVLSSVS